MQQAVSIQEILLHLQAAALQQLCTRFGSVLGCHVNKSIHAGQSQLDSRHIHLLPRTGSPRYKYVPGSCLAVCLHQRVHTILSLGNSIRACAGVSFGMYFLLRPLGLIASLLSFATALRLESTLPRQYRASVRIARRRFTPGSCLLVVCTVRALAAIARNISPESFATSLY